MITALGRLDMLSHVPFKESFTSRVPIPYPLGSVLRWFQNGQQVNCDSHSHI